MEINSDTSIMEAISLYEHGVVPLLDDERYLSAVIGIGMVRDHLGSAWETMPLPSLKARIQKVYYYLGIFKKHLDTGNSKVIQNGRERLEDQLSILWHLTN